MMNPRLAAMAALCREAAIPASVLVWIVAFGPMGINYTGASPIVGGPAPFLTAVAKFADKLPPVALVAANVEIASRPVTKVTAANATPASDEPEPIVTAALTDSSEMLRPETTPDFSAKMSIATPRLHEANHAVDTTEVLDECFAVDKCIDRYLWVLYQRTPKEDAVKTQEQRKVTVRKKGRLVTVTKIFTILADEDFSWKDPKAAERAGMPMTDYVIGGMDRDFKVKLFHILHVAEDAGELQARSAMTIANRLQAASKRPATGHIYGHGLAADLVSVNGATRAQRMTSSETLWNWIDAHGKEFGIGRPYLDRDPPNVGPIDGKEYASHHPEMKAAKPNNRVTLRGDRSALKRVRTARSSKVRTI